MRFWREKKGVAEVLGVLLIFVILVALYASIQATMVPIWNNQIDVEAYETTYGDMLFLKSDVKNVALLKQPKSTTIRMGARYPDRMIFINPKQGIYGSMTKEDTTVRVQYTIEAGGQTLNFDENFTSSRLIYESLGAERNKIIYEHGLIIRVFPNGSVSTDAQELIVGDELYVPLLDTRLFSPMSSIRPESLSLKPFTGARTRLNITDVPPVTVTLPTDYPRVWADRLEGLNTARTTISVNQTAKQIIVTSTAIRRITFPGDPATDATLSAGVIFFGTKTEEGFDPTMQFPNLYNVIFTANGKTSTTISATVKNVTAPFDIHADLSTLTKVVLKYDEPPTRSPAVPWDWDVHNGNGPFDVEWENITHPEFAVGTPLAVTFWVYNSVLDQRYMTTAVTYRADDKSWGH